MIVCLCRRVSDRDIASAAKDGCASFDELQVELGVGTCCGRCGDYARDVFDRCAGTVPLGVGASPVAARALAQAA